ncbi:MAG: glycine cleavage system protein H, partial [SAR324 cluster bacterium]|nr:glycine cleavage system protein H [SAR324 cluster bacterium]
MITIPEDNLYTREHEWVRIEGNKAEVGITEHAQKSL